jgi:hypothetical protein
MLWEWPPDIGFHLVAAVISVLTRLVSLDLHVFERTTSPLNSPIEHVFCFRVRPASISVLSWLVSLGLHVHEGQQQQVLRISIHVAPHISITRTCLFPPPAQTLTLGGHKDAPARQDTKGKRLRQKPHFIHKSLSSLIPPRPSLRFYVS